MPLDLVRQWFDYLRCCDEDPQEALNRLALAVGVTYDLNRLLQWQRGERPIPAPVQAFMRRECLGMAIVAEGGQPPPRPHATRRLARRLEPPARKR